MLEVVGQLSGWGGGGGSSGPPAGEVCVPARPPGRRHLHVLALTRPHILRFTTTLLIHALRQRIFVDSHSDDFCIGHLITLLQVSE